MAVTRMLQYQWLHLPTLMKIIIIKTSPASPLRVDSPNKPHYGMFTPCAHCSSLQHSHYWPC